jgi:hypothetical protein
MLVVLGRTARRSGRVAAVAGAVAVAGVLMTAQTAYAAPYDGTYATDTGCDRTARTVSSVALNGGNAIVELRYSSGCRTAWARITLRNGMTCNPGDDRCGFARITRNSDGLNYQRSTPAGTNVSTFTRQVNDAGVTSFAYGCFDNGARSYCDRTASY